MSDVGHGVQGSAFARALGFLAGWLFLDRVAFAPVTTNYNTLGGASFTGTETNAQSLMPSSGKFKKMTMRVSVNSIVGISNFTLRKNGAPTALTIAVAGLAIGNFEVIVDVSFVKNDLFSVEYAIGAGGSSINTVIQVQLTIDD